VEAAGFRHLEDRLVHAGFVWDLVRGRFEGPDGESFERDVVRSPGAVGVVPLLDGHDGGEPTVVLVAQYRAAFDRVLVEVPAGMCDVEGEPPEETARRELAEEVGLAAGSITPLFDIIASPGMTDQMLWLFVATDCRPSVREAHGVEEEHSEVIELPLSEALAWVADGRIQDAKSVIGLLLVDQRLRAEGG
jgi:nudix-type nucleoside diphosphatase (YffH/AdpP family)